MRRLAFTISLLLFWAQAYEAHENGQSKVKVERPNSSKKPVYVPFKIQHLRFKGQRVLRGNVYS